MKVVKNKQFGKSVDLEKVSVWVPKMMCIDTYKDQKQSVSTINENLKGSQKQHNNPNTTKQHGTEPVTLVD
jgi:hypothetical protein